MAHNLVEETLMNLHYRNILHFIRSCTHFVRIMMEMKVKRTNMATIAPDDSNILSWTSPTITAYIREMTLNNSSEHCQSLTLTSLR